MVQSSQTLGELVKKARVEMRVSPRSLAEIVGVNTSHITYIENNRRRPSIPLMSKLANALEIDGREMLVVAHPEAQHLIAEYRKKVPAWNQFISNAGILDRYRISRAELRILKRISELEVVSHPRHFIFMLNAIRLAIEEQ
jgi:transcriptional regulator with XRE-family HTH domain